MAMQDQSDVRGWSGPLSLLHLLLAVAVTAQLFIGSFMRSPHPGRPDSFGFMTHEVLGATILVLIVLHWTWSFTHPDEGIRHLFPWTRAGLRRVLADVARGLRQRRLPAGGPGDRGLAGFVHGLGLLAISAMVVIGGTFFVLRAAGASHATLELVEDVHDVFAMVVWVYWGGHLAITLLHQLLHQPLWRRMFSAGR
ncbi:MAG TPA: cytochrome b/b6 domain-containing protein [Rhodanobacteraceae bacterium]